MLLLRDGLACCRRSSVPSRLHPCIAQDLAQLIVESCDEGEVTCGSLAEAEGMLREALPLAEEDLWQLKASILKDLTDLLSKQGRHEEAVRAMQEHVDLMQEHETAEASGEEASGEEASGDDSQ